MRVDRAVAVLGLGVCFDFRRGDGWLPGPRLAVASVITPNTECIAASEDPRRDRGV